MLRDRTRRGGPGAARGVALGVGLAVALALGSALPRPDFLANLDESLRDGAVRALAAPQPEDRLTVVDIDEHSIARIGPWPWPRGVLADLVEALIADYGARAVALDMVLPDAADADGDARLAALAAGGPLVLAAALDFVERPQPIRRGEVGRGLDVAQADAPAAPRRAATGWLANHGGVGLAACAGNIGYVPDPDGRVRRLPLLSEAGANAQAPTLVPSLALALLHGCDAPATLALSALLAGGGRDWRVPFGRRLEAYTVVPAGAILDGRAPHALVAGRYVLVGASALGLADRVASPLHASSSGVLVHAAALTALLDVQADPAAPARARRLAGLPGAWLALSLLALTVLAARGSVWRAMGGFALCGLVWAGVVAACVRGGIAVAPLSGLAGYAVLAALLLPYEWGRQRSQARRLRRTFEHYVAKPVLDELLRHPELDSLSPAHREITVLVADMEGYSGHTERLSLAEAGELTRAFLDCLTEPTIRLQGTIDKYTGDGMVAFWGAPLADARHAEHALAAAREILARIDAFNRLRAARGEPPVRGRIGIESGRALVGDLGTRFRSTYTAVGDCINIASRLEQMGRDYPWDVLIGENCAALAHGQPLQPVATLRIRGLQRSVRVFRFDDSSRPI